MASPYQIRIRQPLVLRIYICVFLVAWVGVIAWMMVLHHHGSSIAAGVVFGVLGCAVGYRLLRLGVMAEHDGTLRVHNQLGTRQLSRGEVKEFRIGK